jgi:hypothetical protein
MRCPRCNSPRVQRGYDDTPLVLRIAGLHELLCNNCGLEFKGFDLLGKVPRKPVHRRESGGSRRRAPRFKVHLPASVAMIHRRGQTRGSYTPPSRAHCETISQLGVALSFVGTRFSEDQISQRGCLLFVTVDLPDGRIEAVISTVSSERLGENGKGKWLVGGAIEQISEDDAARLNAFLEKRLEEEPVLALHGVAG